MCAPTRDDLSPYGIGGGGRDAYKDNPTKQAAYDAEVAKNQAKLKEGGYEMPVGFRVREPMDMVTGPFGQGLSQALWSKKYDEENPSITMSAPAIDNPAPIYTFFAIPTPPVTTNEPVVVDVESVASVI